MLNLKLTCELDVNLEGLEIILNQREKMEGFIANLNQEPSQRVSNSRPAASDTLMLVIQINYLGLRTDAKKGGVGKRAPVRRLGLT